MKVKNLIGVTMPLCVLASMADVETVFTGTVDKDFNNASNWDAGLPGLAESAAVNSSAFLTADFARPTGSFSITVGRGTSGDLTIPAGITLGAVVGTDHTGDDTLIGVGAGGSGIFNVAGSYQAIGAGVDLFIGDADGGYGVVNVHAGGFIDMRKAVEIINGKLSYAATASPTSFKDELVVDNGGTLEFIIDGADVATINGRSLAVELGSTSTLELTPTGAFIIGQSWTLITGVSGFSGVDGGDGTGIFGSVFNEDGLEFEATYDDVNGELIATLTSLATKAYGPSPSNYKKNVETGLNSGTVPRELSWNAPEYTGATFDIYLGTTVPNDLLPGYGLTKLNAAPQAATSIPPTAIPLVNSTTYYWVVDTREPNALAALGYDLHPGNHWSFTTVTANPVINTEQD